MRNVIAQGVIGLAACLALAAPGKLQPLNAKPGLWQTTSSTKYTGLPPQMAAALNPTMKYKSCVKPKDLNSNEWILGFKCSTWTVLSSTGTDMDVQAKACEVGHGMTADGHVKLHLGDSEHLTGSIDIDFTGFNPNGSAVHVHGDYSSQWLGATCPADID